MNILIATIGTRGDVQPFLALAIGLQAAGHAVTICTCPRFQDDITSHGVAFCNLEDGLLKLLETNFGRSIIGDLNSIWGVIKTIPKVLKQVGPIHRQMVTDCWAAAEQQNPDVIVYHPKMFCVPAFAAARNIPAAIATLYPSQVPTGDSALFGPSLGRIYNRFTYRLVHHLTKHGTQSYLRSWRSKHDKTGLSRRASATHTSPDQRIPVLNAYSQTVCPRPSDWPAYATISGYWFLPQDTLDQPSSNPSAWQPPKELLNFLEAGPPPVYFGFGSMAGADPSKVSRIIASAIRQSRVRAVIATGWGGIVTIEEWRR